MRKLLFIVLGISLIACGDKEKSNSFESEDKRITEAIQNQQIPITIPNTDVPATPYTYEAVVEGIQIPWGFTFLPDESILITEKSGKLIHFKDGEKVSISNVPEVYDQGQGGLLDIVLDPDYQNNGWIYFSLATSQGDGNGGNTTIIRAQLEGSQLTNIQQLYKAGPNTTSGIHFGSRIAFDNDGLLYFTVGDRGNREVNPQNIDIDNGKVYRIHPDGSIPSDNPFFGDEDAKKAIFSYGHRNPQGIIFHPITKEIWAHEHGPKGGDEINVIKAGANYGWPILTFGDNYDGTTITEETSRPDMESPIYYWQPSIAPSGFTFVTSDKYPKLKGNLLVGSLKFQYLEHLILDNYKVTKREKLLAGIGRLRDVRQGPDGFLYAAVEGKGIIRILPKN